MVQRFRLSLQKATSVNNLTFKSLSIMKKYIIFLIFINYFSAFSQALPISSPINRSVYQRNSNSNTATSTVTFAGQVSEGVNLLGAIKTILVLKLSDCF
jgi:hypothetical protein